jgi:hypothetical protein
MAFDSQARKRLGLEAPGTRSAWDSKRLGLEAPETRSAWDSKRLGLEAPGTRSAWDSKRLGLRGHRKNIFTVKSRAAEPRHGRRHSLRTSLADARRQWHRSAIWQSCLARVPDAYASGYRMPRLRRSGVTVHQHQVLITDPIGVICVFERGSWNKCASGMSGKRDCPLIT